MDLFIHQWNPSIKLFDIRWLESEAITELFEEVSSYVQNIRIEMVSYPGRKYGIEEYPTILIGLRQKKTTIRFIDSLDQRQRVEAMAHELAHLLLIYRYGLSLIDHKSLYTRGASRMFKGGMDNGKNWVFFLGQMSNTMHHLILVPYLKEIYGIESRLQFHLLKSSCTPSIDLNDQESHYTGGLIAYEYKRLVGTGNQWADLYCQSKNFWKAFKAAGRYFHEYSYPSIPSSSRYEENILSFLKDLGYLGDEFIFFPPR